MDDFFYRFFGNPFGNDGPDMQQRRPKRWARAWWWTAPATF